MICGLDFGTSNSTVGVIRKNQTAMVPLEPDVHGAWQTTMPSALYFSFGDNSTEFGRRAISRYTAGEPGRLLRSMKSVLGSSFMEDKTQVKSKHYSYEEIIGFFVAHLKQQAEDFTGGALESVVVGRPVFFNDTDSSRDAAAQDQLAAIAKRAGFSEVSFQFEPIAAALDYERQVTREEIALIIDIGGGTSDFTVVRLSSKRQSLVDRKHDFLANNGVHIGGTDFDQRLSIIGVMQHFGMGVALADRPSLRMPGHYYFDLATWHKIHLLYDRSVLLELQALRSNLSDKRPLDRLLALLKKRKGHQLAALVEEAKIALSEKSITTLPLHNLIAECADIGDCELSREQLENSLARDLAKIFSAVDDTLKQAGIERTKISTVFTTGGSTALPMVKAGIRRAFPDASHIVGDLYNSVGAGLLQEAVHRYG